MRAKFILYHSIAYAHNLRLIPTVLLKTEPGPEGHH